ncbi:MAG: DUF3800 domain-containing protein [Sedimentisphaerales bacterium]|nr:DUF3800 domain-containing protein [Sedimentisphaerales bacterium]
MKYRMYVDEVGNPDLESSSNPLHRFLSLTGVIIGLQYVSKVLYPQMEKLKSDYFGSHPDDPVILHRKEVINAKHPFEALRDTETRSNFDKDLLKLLADWEYTVISVCLDKKSHKETYQVWRYDPYHYCLTMLLERFTFFLEQHETKGDVMAESRGGKEDTRLKKSFSRLQQEGTEYMKPKRFQSVHTSKQLKVKPKANNISGLQLADLIAYPSRNEILKENNQFDRELPPFAKKVIEILQRKYYQRMGSIFGKKFI